MLGGGAAGLPPRPARNSGIPGGHSSPRLTCPCSRGPPGPPRPWRPPPAGAPGGAGGWSASRPAPTSNTAAVAHVSIRVVIDPASDRHRQRATLDYALETPG